MQATVVILVTVYVLTVIINKTSRIKSRWKTIGYSVFFLVTFFSKPIFGEPLYLFMWLLFFSGVPIFIVNRFTGPWKERGLPIPAAIFACLLWVLNTDYVEERIGAPMRRSIQEEKKNAIIDSLYEIHKSDPDADSLINSFLVDNGFEEE